MCILFGELLEPSIAWPFDLIGNILQQFPHQSILINAPWLISHVSECQLNIYMGQIKSTIYHPIMEHVRYMCLLAGGASQ